MVIRISQEDQPDRLQEFRPGVFVAGRDPSCDCQLSNGKVSRRHCEIRAQGGKVTVTDLHSQNGTYLADSRLPPGQAVEWSASQTLGIGPFVLRLGVRAPEKADAPLKPAWAAPGPGVLPASTRSWRIACGHAKPSAVTVRDQPIIIGRGQDCDMVLDDTRVSRHQCRVHQQGNQLWVTDLSGHDSTRIGDEPLSANTAQVWPEGIHLKVGPFALVQWAESQVSAPAADASSLAAAEPLALPAEGALGTRMWLEWVRHLPWLPIAMVIGGICLILGVGAGLYQVFFRPTPTPVTAVSATSTAQQEATATPVPPATEAPTSTPSPTRAVGSGVMLPSPTPTYVPMPGCTPQAAGWLEIPFPYDGDNQGVGTAEQFRAASQRTAAGGRINSFFDHQFPLYKGEADVIEALQPRDTMILFDGSISLDRTTHPDQEGDFYSGHPGIDFSVYGWLKVNTPIETPILAPADGLFAGAGTDNLGNNYVHLTHDRGEDGVFRTSFLHLEPDQYFDRMLGLAPGTPIRLGERIGTMGNTGNSSGHHLHFEVRHDCNGNGLFELAEAVDPYGFRASVETQVDPMAALTCGGSEYLWKYTWDPEDEGGGCAQPQSRRQLDPTPFQGFISLAAFVFTTADPSTPTRVPIWLTRANVSKVDLGSVKVHRYEIDAASGVGNWVVVPESRVLADQSGRPYVEVYLSVPGKYTVTGRPIKDIIPPKTSIRLSGVQQNGAFVGTLTVELAGQDDSEQGVREIHYSVDCGQNWSVYGDLPLRLTAGDLTQCTTTETDQKGDEWGLHPDEYLVLAAAVDWSGNWEQPASFQRFSFSQ